jgi:YD repeat-containing protein
MLNMNLYVSDIPIWHVPPIGPPVKITMSHNSRSAIEANASFGNKWTFNYGSYLVVGASDVTLTMPDGRKDIFTSDGNGGFASPYGVFNKLAAVGSNYELTFVDGITTVYGIPSGSGIVNPVILQIRDSYSQNLTFGYNSNDRLATITDAATKVTSITYFPENGSKQGLIQSVQDPFGRSASFDYTNGTLTSVTDMGGYSTSYQYDSNGYLSLIQNGNGTWGFTTELQGSTSIDVYYPAPGAEMGQTYRITVTDPPGWFALAGLRAD